MTVKVLSSGSGWDVTVHGTTHSQHRKKARAVEEARKVASKRGLELRVQRNDGTWQPRGGF